MGLESEGYYITRRGFEEIFLDLFNKRDFNGSAEVFLDVHVLCLFDLEFKFPILNSSITFNTYCYMILFATSSKNW